MTKKIDTSSAMSKFFSQGTQDTQNPQNKQNTHENHENHENHNNHDTQENSIDGKRKAGRPTKTPEERKRGYRYNLTLDKDLNAFLHFMAWKNKTSMTQYINDLIRDLMEEHLKNGGSPEDWSDWD